MRKINAFIGFVLCLLIGIITTVVVTRSYSEWEKFFPVKFEIDLLQIVSLIVTVWLAYYVARVLDRRSNQDLNIALLISAKIETIFDALKGFHSELNINDSCTLSQANSFAKSLDMRKKTVQTLISRVDRLNIGTRIRDFDQEFVDILREISTLTTFTSPTPGSAPQDITISDGQYKYSQSRISMINQQIQKLENLLITLQFEVFSTN